MATAPTGGPVGPPTSPSTTTSPPPTIGELRRQEIFDEIYEKTLAIVQAIAEVSFGGPAGYLGAYSPFYKFQDVIPPYFETTSPFSPAYTATPSGIPDTEFAVFYDDGTYFGSLPGGADLLDYGERSRSLGWSRPAPDVFQMDETTNAIFLRDAVQWLDHNRMPDGFTMSTGDDAKGVVWLTRALILELFAELEDLGGLSSASGAPSEDEGPDSGDPPEASYGIPEDEFDALVEGGQALGPCEPQPAPPPAIPECPPCIEDPDAYVPDWRNNNDGDVFLNQRTCEYCVTIFTDETDITVLNDTATREAFLEEQKEVGVQRILEYFGKTPLDEASTAIVLDAAITKQYDVPIRPLLALKALVCVPVDVIEAITIIDTDADPEEPPIGPTGCVLKAEEIRSMIRRVREAFRFYGHKYALWSYTTGQVIPGFSPTAENQKLQKFVPALVQLMNRNGFKLNGKNAAEKVEFRFNENYELIFAQAKERGCEPVELIWKKDGDNLGGFKQLEPINDPRTMAYIASLKDMHDDAAARDPKAWDEFFTEYTYPPISTDDVEDPLGDPALADGPLQQAAQSIVDEIVSLPDAIVSKFSEQVCRDRNGQAIHDADIREFDDMLKRAIYSRGKIITIGDDTFLKLPELLQAVANIDELYSEILNKLGVCGLLDLLSVAIECLTNGIDLEEALSIIVRAALKAMDPGNLEKLFIGLPPDKQLEVKEKVFEALGSIEAPWDQGYQPGSYNYEVNVNPDGTPTGKDFYAPNPDFDNEKPVGDDNKRFVLITAEEDNRSIAERTTQYRMESQPQTRFGGGAGSIGTAVDTSLDAIFDAYIEAILDSVDAEFLLEQINKFPGAELITRVLINPDCPPAPLFNPPLNEFMKTLELDFCRGQYAITLPKLQKINVPDFYRMFMEALLEVLMQLAIKIIITILNLVLKIVLNGLCNLLGVLGDLASELFASQPSNNFAESIKQSLSSTGLNNLGIPIPIADDDTLNNAAANLFSTFSRSCTDASELPNAEQVSDFLNEVGLILTQGEFVDLVTGVAAEEVHKAIYQLTVLRHPAFLCVFPNVGSIPEFFRYLGNMIDPSFATLGLGEERGVPVFPGVCQDATSAAKADNLRGQLFANRGLNPDLIDEQLEFLKCQALADLEELVNISQNGLFADLPPILDTPDCNIPGLVPRDPSPDDLPQGPVGLLVGPFGLFEGTFDIYDKMYYKDLMGRGGFLNMVLSDRDGRGRREHNSYVASKAIFGISSTRPNSREELLPVSVAKYLEYILKNPNTAHNNSTKFHKRPFSFALQPNVILGYSNYFPDNEDDWYAFDINLTAVDNTATVLNNRYELEVVERFNYTKEPAIRDDGTIEDPKTGDTFVETLSISADPGLPSGVEEFITTELGLDIETVLASGTASTPASNISAQSAVFGKYIEKILRDALPEEALGTATAEDSLSFIADACMTDMYDYINSGFFSYIAGSIAFNNEAFKYGEGGDDFVGNTPKTYPETKIFLDETHVYPPEHPQAGTPLPLDPLAWGGNNNLPAFYNRPPQNRPGWVGIADKMIPEADACDPKRENVIGFKEISDYATEFYQKINDDPRLDSPSACPIEEPCNKILSRAAASMIEGNIKATIRIYAAEAFLKGMPAFVKFKADLNELYEDSLSAYITETLKRGFFQYSKKGFGRRKTDEYYFQFLEQCVQNFGRKIDAGLIEPTTEEQQAIDVINALQQIWKKDTNPPSGKPYAGTGERLKRVLSPGFFGAQLKNIFNKNYNVPLNSEDGALSKRAAKKLKEESYDYFMREIEDQAEVILKRYIAEELKYISDEFAERIPPEHRTLYEVFLGGAFGTYGSIAFNNGVIGEVTPLDDATFISTTTPSPTGDGDITVSRPGVFSVVHSAAMVLSTPIGTDENEFLKLYTDPSNSILQGPQPQSVKAYDVSNDVYSVSSGIVSKSDRYWPFVLEQYIQIEDYTRDYWLQLVADGVDLTRFGALDVEGVPEVWNTTQSRPDNLYGVVKADEWQAYLDSEAASYAGFTRSDLWRGWSYGLRIVFIPPNRSGPSFTNSFGIGTTTFDATNPGTDIRLPKSVQIKDKIDVIQTVTTSARPFNTETSERNKAFYFTDSGATPTPEEAVDNPMSIPVARGVLQMPMGVDTLSTDWTESFDSVGGFGRLVQELVCSNEYKMLFRYCFNMPRITSTIAIYIIQGFLPSIGKAGESDPPDTSAIDEEDFDPAFEGIMLGSLARAFDNGENDDGWYEPKGLAALFSGEYYGGGLNSGLSGLGPFSFFADIFTTNFKEWQWFKAFHRTKKLAAQSFMDLYNSEDPSYTSDAFSDPTIQEDAKNQLKVSWPKFSLRLWSKRVDRPYDKNGDLCFNPDDDYQD